MNSYAARAAAFATAYVAVFWASAEYLAPVPALIPPIAVGALWLVAQTRFAKRRLDVIALATAGAVAATLQGAGLLMCLVVAAGAVAPPLLFAVLLQRWLPGYWLGHGDRFRSTRAALGRLAGAAALAAVTGFALYGLSLSSISVAEALLQLGGVTAVLVLAVLAVRATRRTRNPRGNLSVVR
ncbi:hypothetical protein AB0M02_41210 [Actinoplanes sp. NPDC051861]|uniref:hypothetical protein n=1 Tax=Actinoplanes sp. NPDC051861 TaxID=3155170 RepID=UPI00341F490A